MTPYVIWFLFYLSLVWAPFFRNNEFSPSDFLYVVFSYFTSFLFLKHEAYFLFLFFNYTLSFFTLLNGALLYASGSPENVVRSFFKGTHSIFRFAMSTITFFSAVLF